MDDMRGVYRCGRSRRCGRPTLPRQARKCYNVPTRDYLAPDAGPSAYAVLEELEPDGEAATHIGPAHGHPAARRLPERRSGIAVPGGAVDWSIRCGECSGG